MKKFVHVATSSLLLGLAAPVWANEVPAPAAGAAVEPASLGASPQTSGGRRLTAEEERFFQEQARLQRETMLMESRAKLMEQQAKYAEMQQKIMEAQAPKPKVDSMTAGIPSTLPGGTPVVVSNAGAMKEVDPADMRLVSVFGHEKNPSAEIVFRGARLAVKKGDQLPGGWKVKTITSFQVDVEKSGVKRTIDFGDDSSKTSSINIPLTMKP